MDKGLSTEMLEMIQRVEREARFWSKLEEIGFIVTRDVVGSMSHIKHSDLPIRHSFYLDKAVMEIKKMTVETGSWLRTTDGVGNIMTCENFIKCMIHRVRAVTADILAKLDTGTF